MSGWIVIPCLLALRDEFNALNPGRDKGADGTIGDSSHTSSSDHTPDEDSGKLQGKDSDHVNEVHALDIDSTGPWAGATFHAIVMKVIEWEKKKWLDPNDKCRLNYVIWDHKIYDKDNDFAAATYTGSDPHTNHAHFSARYETSCENDRRPWGVVATFGDDMPSADEVAKETVKQMFEREVQDYADPKEPNRKLTFETWVGYSEGRGQVNDVKKELAEVKSQMAELSGQVTGLVELIESHISGLIENQPPA
jgi:hypothetical protein